MIRANRILTRHQYTFTLLRPTTARQRGEYRVTAVEEIPFTTSFQPLSVERTKLLKEGDRTEDFRDLFTGQMMFTADRYTKTSADVVADAQGYSWKVVRVAPWGDGNRNNQIMVQKIGPPITNPQDKIGGTIDEFYQRT